MQALERTALAVSMRLPMLRPRPLRLQRPLLQMQLLMRTRPRQCACYHIAWNFLGGRWRICSSMRPVFCSL